MKSIYLFLLMFVFSATVLAQRSVNLEALPSLIGKSASNLHELANNEKILYDGDGINSKYYFVWRVKNLGPDALIPGDSLIFRTGFLSIAPFVFGPNDSLQKDSSIGIYPVNSNNQHTFVTLSPNNSVTTSHSTPNVPWCDSVWAKQGTAVIADPVMTNNEVCRTVELTFWLTGVNTVTYKADGFLVYPNPANGKLNVKFDLGSNAKNVSVVLRDVISKVVYSHSFGDTSGNIEHAINVTHLTAGMYTAELNYNGQKIVSKVSIQ